MGRLHGFLSKTMSYIEPSVHELCKLCIQQTLLALLEFWTNGKQFPNNADLEVIGWNRLYVKKNRSYLILSNIQLEEHLRGKKILTRLLKQFDGVPVAIECPSPRLLTYCLNNNFNVLGNLATFDESKLAKRVYLFDL